MPTKVKFCGISFGRSNDDDDDDGDIDSNGNGRSKIYLLISRVCRFWFIPQEKMHLHFCRGKFWNSIYPNEIVRLLLLLLLFNGLGRYMHKCTQTQRAVVVAVSTAIRWVLFLHAAECAIVISELARLFAITQCRRKIYIFLIFRGMKWKKWRRRNVDKRRFTHTIMWWKRASNQPNSPTGDHSTIFHNITLSIWYTLFSAQYIYCCCCYLVSVYLKSHSSG